MYALEHRVGRLVEIRIASPVSLVEAVQWGRDHNALIDSIRGPYVCLVDLACATVFPQKVVDAYVSTMRGEERLIRTGTLLNQSPTLGMQIQRMIKDANHPDRKAFRDPRELFAWLGEVLDDAEKERLHDVLLQRMGAVSRRAEAADTAPRSDRPVPRSRRSAA
jgi:hypothetical protein